MTSHLIRLQSLIICIHPLMWTNAMMNMPTILLCRCRAFLAVTLSSAGPMTRLGQDDAQFWLPLPLRFALGFPLPLGHLDPGQPSPLPEPRGQLLRAPPSAAQASALVSADPGSLMQRKQPVSTQQVHLLSPSHTGLSSSRFAQGAHGCLMSCVRITFRLTPLTTPETGARNCTPVSAWISLTLLSKRSVTNLFHEPDHWQPCAWAYHAGRAPEHESGPCQDTCVVSLIGPCLFGTPGFLWAYPH